MIGIFQPALILEQFFHIPGMPVPGSRRRGPERLLVGGFEVTPHGLFIGAVIGGLVAAVALLCIFHFTKPKPKKRKPVLAVDFDEVCVGYLAAFIEFNNETYGTTLVFADFETCALSRFVRPPLVHSLRSSGVFCAWAFFVLVLSALDTRRGLCLERGRGG